MKPNKKQKKLIGLNALKKANEMYELGVPVSKIHTQLGLDKIWSYVSTQLLLKPDFEGLYDATRPDWLQDEPLVQVPPVDWAFSGSFPYGDWMRTHKERI